MPYKTVYIFHDFTIYRNVSVKYVTLVPWRRERRRHVEDRRIGISLERPIHFECKLNEPMHIGMRLLHPAALITAWA